MAEYRLQDPDKGIVGPIRLATVRDLVAAGVVHDGVQVSRDNGPFMPASTFKEFGLTPGGVAEPQPTYAGDLGKNTFFRVFYRFHATSSTGRLRLQQEALCKDVFLEEGKPVFATSNQPEERLGEYLVAHGKIERSEIEVALASMHTDGNRLGYTLIRLGLIEPHELVATLREQLTDRLVDLCDWHSGRYLFFTGERYEGEHFDLQLDVAEIIIRAARALPLERLEARLAPHWQAIVQPQQQQVVALEALRLSAFEKRVSDNIDGRRSIADLLRDLRAEGDHRRALLMVVYLLWEVDAVSFSG